MAVPAPAGDRPETSLGHNGWWYRFGFPARVRRPVSTPGRKGTDRRTGTRYGRTAGRRGSYARPGGKCGWQVLVGGSARVSAPPSLRVPVPGSPWVSGRRRPSPCGPGPKGVATVRSLSVFALALAATVLLGILLSARYTTITRAGYELDALQSELQVLQKQNDSLRLEVAALKSLGRIESVAVAELGMERPAEVRVVRARYEPGMLLASAPAAPSAAHRQQEPRWFSLVGRMVARWLLSAGDGFSPSSEYR